MKYVTFITLYIGTWIALVASNNGLGVLDMATAFSLASSCALHTFMIMSIIVTILSTAMAFVGHKMGERLIIAVRTEWLALTYLSEFPSL